jgi:hypothetical protein
MLTVLVLCSGISEPFFISLMFSLCVCLFGLWDPFHPGKFVSTTSEEDNGFHYLAPRLQSFPPTRRTAAYVHVTPVPAGDNEAAIHAAAAPARVLLNPSVSKTMQPISHMLHVSFVDFVMHQMLPHLLLFHL